MSTLNAYLYTGAAEFEVAAHYAFHLTEAQAFLDGNKRTGMGAALAFLALNGIAKKATTSDLTTLYDAMIGIAEKRVDKTGCAGVFRRIFSGAR